MKIRFTTKFNCPATQVWDYMTEPDNLPQWVPECVGFRMTSEKPFGPGSTYEMDTRSGKKTVTCFGELLENEPNRLMKEKITGGGFKEGQVMYMTYEFTDKGDRCSMTYTNEFTCGLLMGLMFKTAGKIYCRSMIKRLKKHAEAPPATPA